MKLKIPPETGKIFKESHGITILLIFFVFMSLTFSDVLARSKKEIGGKKEKAEPSEHMQVLPRSTTTAESITVTSPNGGEDWCQSLFLSITWSSSEIESVKIEFSADGGQSWSTIVSSTPSDGSEWVWTFPPLPGSTQCLIRICDVDGNPCDQSDSLFTISEPSLMITSPYSGEHLLGSTTHDITWNSKCVSYVSIDYRTDPFSGWINITPNTPSDGSFAWTVPCVNSNQCQIKVQPTPGYTIYSNYFTITSESLTVTSPDGGESWCPGSWHDITWRACWLDSVKIDYSRNGGATWINIVPRTSSTGSYYWNVPNASSNNCLVRICDIDGSPCDESDSSFTIPTQDITLTSPNGGEIWYAGELHTITWTSSGICYFAIDYSTDEGISWYNFYMDYGPNCDMKEYSWTIPWYLYSSSTYRIRVSDAFDAYPYDISDNDFTIVVNKSPQQRVQRSNDINMCMTNWGTWGSKMRELKETKGGCFNPHADTEEVAPSFEFPAGSGLEYLFQGAIWIGTKVNDLPSPFVSVGCDGWFWVYELWPDSLPPGAIQEKSTIGGPCYSPGAVSEQDIISVYTDTSADIPFSPEQIDPWDNRKHFPLHVQITQKTYSWSSQGYEDFIIADYFVKNIGSDSLSDILIGFYMDPCVTHISEDPDGPYGGQDDITGFLKVYQGDTVNIAWAADNDGFGLHHYGYWDAVSLRSVMGVKLLYPHNPNLHLSYNWWASDQRGTPYDWGPWKTESQQRWGQINPYGAGTNFPDVVLGTPGGDVSKYFIMSNGEIDYDQIYSCVWPSRHPEESWLPSNEEMCSDFANGYNTQFLFSFGPFESLYPGDSLHFAVAYIIGEIFHVYPNNGSNLPNQPDTFYAHLDFSDLVQNALTAQILYDTLLGPTNVKESEKEVPKSFYLSQNYPNPFNLSTIIKYSLEKTSYVSLKIYNIRGELVRTLVEHEQKPGHHQEIWNGKDQTGNEVASGIYFYKLIAGDQSRTKKMILLK